MNGRSVKHTFWLITKNIKYQFPLLERNSDFPLKFFFKLWLFFCFIDLWNSPSEWILLPTTPLNIVTFNHLLESVVEVSQAESLKIPPPSNTSVSVILELNRRSTSYKSTTPEPCFLERSLVTEQDCTLDSDKHPFKIWLCNLLEACAGGLTLWPVPSPPAVLGQLKNHTVYIFKWLEKYQMNNISWAWKWYEIPITVATRH